MPNIAYFDIPADNVDRAKRFYSSLLGWTIEPTKAILDKAAAAASQYQDVLTGKPEEGTIHMGGMYKRQKDETINTFVAVDDIDAVLAKVENLGGKIVMPKWTINGVGLVAMIQDTEGNGFGIWKPEKAVARTPFTQPARDRAGSASLCHDGRAAASPAPPATLITRYGDFPHRETGQGNVFGAVRGRRGRAAGRGETLP